MLAMGTTGNTSWYDDSVSALVQQYAEYWADDDREARMKDKQFKRGYRRTHKSKDWDGADNGNMGRD